MKTVIERIIGVMESRANEKCVHDLIRPKQSSSKDETTMRRMAKRISKSESNRQFDFSSECEVL